jgi:catechol 2,3-dioxygenase-like lactoylglutathione lyase family enzyme
MDLALDYLDHVNLRTRNVAALTRFYRDVLGLMPGDRPAFPFAGAWLYLGDRPVVHLVELVAGAIDDAAQARAASPGPVSLSHFAFRGRGPADAFMARLDAAGVAYRVGALPGSGIVQVNLQDPDGNDLHVDFAPG